MKKKICYGFMLLIILLGIAAPALNAFPCFTMYMECGRKIGFGEDSPCEKLWNNCMTLLYGDVNQA